MHKILSVILILLLLGLGIMAITYFAKKERMETNYVTSESKTTESTTNTTDVQLDKDLKTITLEDPTTDFNSVDLDINSL